MTTIEFIQRFAQDIYTISLCFSALLGFSIGVLFWQRVLK